MHTKSKIAVLVKELDEVKRATGFQTKLHFRNKEKNHYFFDFGTKRGAVFVGCYRIHYVPDLVGGWSVCDVKPLLVSVDFLKKDG